MPCHPTDSIKALNGSLLVTLVAYSENLLTCITTTHTLTLLGFTTQNILSVVTLSLEEQRK